MPNNDLISRKALMDAVDKSQHNNPHSDPTHRAMHKHEHNHFLTMILQAPAVDAAPVVHGFNTYDHNSAFQRSVCDFSDWDTMTADSGKYNYCPNCGAKMDGAKDEFELAGFDEETCEKLRKISYGSGVNPCHIISAIRGCQPDTQSLSEIAQLTSAWYRFKKTLWDEFTKSKIGKFMIRLTDKLSALIERFGK